MAFLAFDIGSGPFHNPKMRGDDAMNASVFAKYVVGETTSTSVSGTLSKAIPLTGEPVLRFLNRLPEMVSAHFEAERAVLKNAKDWKKVRDLRALNLLEAGKEGETLYAVLEYHSGRLLSDVLDRLRREGMPLAADQAVYLTERAAGAALSLAEQGLAAGGLSPDRLFVTFEGEVKILPCLFKGLSATPLAAEPALEPYLRYLPAPEAAQAFKGAADVYSLGALLFEFLCRQPFRNVPAAEFDPAARLEQGRKGVDGAEPIPENLFSLLRKSLLLGSPEAFRSLGAFKEQVDLLITSGEYSPTTFNIAFLMHSLYRGEDEAEDAADKAFLAMDRSPFQVQAAPAPAPPAEAAEREGKAAPRPAPEPSFSAAEQAPAEEAPPAGKKALWLGVAAAAAVVVVGGGIFLALRSRGPSPEELQARQQLEALEKERALFKAQQEEMARRMKALEEEKAALAEQVSKAKTTEEKARAQKALEEAQQRLKAQEEERRRLEEAARKAEAPKPAASSTANPAPVLSSAAPSPAAPPAESPAPEAAPPPAPEPAPQAASPSRVQVGDFVELWAVDIKPKQTNSLQLDVTSPARQNRLKGTFYVEVDVNERGEVTDARVVRGPSPDFGMNDACRRAALRLKFSPALKEGVPVRTKVTFPIVLK
jgi:TonB family protein